MPVDIRVIRQAKVLGLTALGTAGHLAAFPVGTSVRELRDRATPETITVRPTGRSFTAVLPTRCLDAPDPFETGFFKDKNTLVAFRNGETAKAAADWLDYHGAGHRAEAALIIDRDPPGGGFAEDLTALDPKLPVIVVTLEHPLGLLQAPDGRHPALAPAAPKRRPPPIDPWHAPLAQLAIYELLRHRFLAQASAVLFLNPGDLLLPDIEGLAFQRIRDAAGAFVPAQGTECYPWRLRKGQPARHADHIAERRKERRRVATWGVAPKGLPGAVIWKPVRVTGAPALDAAPIPFSRAMGVVFPGVPVQELVRKGDLAENPDLLHLMQTAFKADPIRLPAPGIIPPMSDSHRVTVISAMKNEGPFILDWIAHNRAIGIDRHLVYTNDCADGTEALLDALAPAGVTRRDNPYRDTGKVPQHAAFRAAESEDVVRDADWLLTLDVDEYINIHAGEGHITDLIAAAPEAHVISMPWRLFGNADLATFHDQPVTQQFTHAAPEFAPRPLQAWAFKTLYRNAGLFRRLGVHRPKGIVSATQGDIRWVDGAGREMPPAIWRGCWRMSKANWGYDLVSLNHYAVRSADSFLVKRDRGRVNHTDRDQGAAYWFRMNHNAVEDTSILRLSKRVAAEKDQLLTLPGVAEAHATSTAWHRQRIAELKAQPDHAALYAQINSPKLQNLSRMTTYFGANVHYYGPEVIPDEVALRDPTTPFFYTVEAGHSATRAQKDR